MKKTYPTPLSEHMGEPEVYGYRVKDLILFAQLCNDAGIEQQNLKDFSKDVNYIVNLIAMRMKQAIDNGIKEFSDTGEFYFNPFGPQVEEKIVKDEYGIRETLG